MHSNALHCHSNFCFPYLHLNLILNKRFLNVRLSASLRIVKFYFHEIGKSHVFLRISSAAKSGLQRSCVLSFDFYSFHNPGPEPFFTAASEVNTNITAAEMSRGPNCVKYPNRRSDTKIPKSQAELMQSFWDITNLLLSPSMSGFLNGFSGSLPLWSGRRGNEHLLSWQGRAKQPSLWPRTTMILAPGPWLVEALVTEAVR